MTRKEFLKLSGLLLASPLYSSLLQSETKMMPSLFISHGSPMNIIRDNSFTTSLKEIVKTFDKPKAIIVISAHWYTNNTLISNLEEQETIYDFYGFPDQLYNITYEPKGDEKLASDVNEILKNSSLEDRGLDHGAWSILRHMYPKQDIPTFQISINKNLSYMQHFEIASLLKKLRKNGVLIIGSGSVTHNLRLTDYRKTNVDAWALEFDEYIKEAFNTKNFSNIIEAQKHPLFNIAHPFDDHFIPLLYTAGTIEDNDTIEHFHEEIVSGNLTMRSIKIG